MKMKKYHGLGNDYLVIDASELTGPLSEAAIQLVCLAHYGAGSDGILTGPFLPGSPDFEDIRVKSGVSAGDAAGCLCALRILNPDGSEAEKSGNGLRIFTRYLYDCGLARLNEPFSMLTLGGKVTATVLDPQDGIRVDMGGVRFTSPDFPFQKAEDKTCKVTVGGDDFTVCCATVGNPHCIVLDKEVDEANPEQVARRYGPGLETAPLFPHRTNVQFLKVLGRHDIFISIWERGAGYTLASGSSSSAAAAVAKRLGYCDSPIAVHAPGGVLKVEIDDNWNIVQTGPVRVVYELEWLGETLQ